MMLQQMLVPRRAHAETCRLKAFRWCILVHFSSAVRPLDLMEVDVFVRFVSTFRYAKRQH
jgi:hypothetical protein